MLKIYSSQIKDIEDMFAFSQTLLLNTPKNILMKLCSFNLACLDYVIYFKRQSKTTTV